MAHSRSRTFSAHTVATILGVHVQSVYRWQRDGVLADYTPAALAAFLRAHTNWTGRRPR